MNVNVIGPSVMRYPLWLLLCFTSWLCQHIVAADSLGTSSPSRHRHELRSACPSACSCLGILVDCSGRNLKYIPADIPFWVERLLLQNNGIRSLSDDNGLLASLPRLREIDLSNNRLNTLQCGCFAWWHAMPDSLQKLTLDNNRLQTLEPPFSSTERSAIRPLNNLQYLSARSNRISTSLAVMRQRLLPHILPSLIALDLSYNNISSLTVGLPSAAAAVLLADSTNLAHSINQLNEEAPSSTDVLIIPPHPLRRLNLAGNLIQSVYKKSFASHRSSSYSSGKHSADNANEGFPEAQLTNLQQIDLSFNHIETIDGLAFNGLEVLQSLDLSHNRLLNLSDGAFFGLGNVQTITLSHNYLSMVRQGWAYGLDKCVELNLSSNRITAIDQRVWQLVPLLRRLDLSSNRLGTALANEHLSETSSEERFAFHFLANLRMLDLSSNGLEFIHENAFHDCQQLRVLLLAHNNLAWMVEDRSSAQHDDNHEDDGGDDSYEDHDDAGRNSSMGFPLSLTRDISFASLSSSPFSVLTKLRYLSLSNNSISIVPAFALDYVFAARHVEYSPEHAGFRSRSQSVSSTTGTILELDLSANPIVYIDAAHQGFNFVIVVDSPVASTIPDVSAEQHDEAGDQPSVGLRRLQRHQPRIKSSSSLPFEVAPEIVIRLFVTTEHYVCDCKRSVADLQQRRLVLAPKLPTEASFSHHVGQFSAPEPPRSPSHSLYISHMQCNYPIAYRNLSVFNVPYCNSRDNKTQMHAAASATGLYPKSAYNFSPPLPSIVDTTTTPHDLKSGVVVGNVVYLRCVAQLHVPRAWFAVELSNNQHNDAALLKFSWLKDHRKVMPTGAGSRINMPRGSRVEITNSREIIPDNNDAEQNERIFIRASTLLKIHGMTEADAGNYQCVAQSEPAGAAYSRQMQINVHIFPRFTKAPRDVTVPLGRAVQLECAAEGRPRPSVWWRRGDAVRAFPAAKTRRLRNDGDALILVNVTREDAGLYVCTASNLAGTATSNATVRVVDKVTAVSDADADGMSDTDAGAVVDRDSLLARIAARGGSASGDGGLSGRSNVMTELRANAGRDTAITCSVVDIPSNDDSAGKATSTVTNIFWLRNGLALRTDAKHMILNDGKLLVINSVQPLDSGIYTCRVATRKVVRPAALGDSNNTTIISSTDDHSTYLEVLHPPALGGNGMTAGFDDANVLKSSNPSHRNEKAQKSTWWWPSNMSEKEQVIVACVGMVVVAAIVFVGVVWCVRHSNNNKTEAVTDAGLMIAADGKSGSSCMPSPSTSSGLVASSDDDERARLTSSDDRFMPATAVRRTAPTLAEYSPGTTETYLTPSTVMMSASSAHSLRRQQQRKPVADVGHDAALLSRSLLPNSSSDKSNIYAGVPDDNDDDDGTAFFHASFSPAPSGREWHEHFRRAQSLKRSLSQQKLPSSSKSAAAASAFQPHESVDPNYLLQRQASYGNIYGTTGRRSKNQRTNSGGVADYRRLNGAVSSLGLNRTCRSPAVPVAPLVDRASKPRNYCPPVAAATTRIFPDVDGSSSFFGKPGTTLPTTTTEAMPPAASSIVIKRNAASSSGNMLAKSFRHRPRQLPLDAAASRLPSQNNTEQLAAMGVENSFNRERSISGGSGLRASMQRRLTPARTPVMPTATLDLLENAKFCTDR